MLTGASGMGFTEASPKCGQVKQESMQGIKQSAKKKCIANPFWRAVGQLEVKSIPGEGGPRSLHEGLL